MNNLKDSLCLKSQLPVFILHHAVVLLLLTCYCEGQSPPILVMLGDDVTLPCQLEPASDATDLTVEWARRDLDPRFVYLRRDGSDLLLEQHPSYVGRAKLSTSKLTCGDVSLTLSKVKLSDTGTYTCLVPKFSKDSGVEVVVGSVSPPIIQISKASSAVVLRCESKGWYPEPEVLWLDSEGNLLSAGPTETVRGPDDLYTVSSTVTVEKTDSNSFTCRVQQRDINQTRETLVYVPGDFSTASSSSLIRITISLVVCFVCVLLIVALVWKIIKLERDRKHPMTMTNLEVTKAKLEEDLQKNEEEMKHVEQTITTLTEQKKDLKNQREILTPMLQDVKIQKDENKKLKLSFYTWDKEGVKQRHENTTQELESRMEALQKLLKGTEELLDTTEDMINRMTEKKGKLKRDKEQIKKHLKKTNKERDELQRKLQVEQTERKKEEHEP